MTNKQEPRDMKRRIQTLHRQMAKLGPFMRGTVVVIGTRKKQPYFSLNKDKKTRLIYIWARNENCRPDKCLPLTRNYSQSLRK